jgi:hypothetical protein
MQKQRTKSKDLTFGQRLLIAVVGLGLIASGIINVMRGRLHYQTYWHAPMFFPFLILIGILILAVAFIRPRE